MAENTTSSSRDARHLQVFNEMLAADNQNALRDIEHQEAFEEINQSEHQAVFDADNPKLAKAKKLRRGSTADTINVRIPRGRHAKKAKPKKARLAELGIPEADADDPVIQKRRAEIIEGEARKVFIAGVPPEDHFEATDHLNPKLQRRVLSELGTAPDKFEDVTNAPIKPRPFDKFETQGDAVQAEARKIFKAGVPPHLWRQAVNHLSDDLQGPVLNELRENVDPNTLPESLRPLDKLEESPVGRDDESVHTEVAAGMLEAMDSPVFHASGSRKAGQRVDVVDTITEEMARDFAKGKQTDGFVPREFIDPGLLEQAEFLHDKEIGGVRLELLDAAQTNMFRAVMRDFFAEQDGE